MNGFFQDAVYQATRSDQFGSSHRLDAYQSLQKDYYQPYATASCIFDVVKDGSDVAPLQFPRISETSSDLNKDRDTVSIPGLTKGQIVSNLPDDHFTFHVYWIDLPQDRFDTGIPGAVIINPQGTNVPPYNIYQCTSDAGWGSSAMMSDSEQSGSVTSRRMNDLLPVKTTGITDTFGYISTSYPDFANISNLPFPERRISVSENWMKFLNPTLVLADNSTTTFISQYLSSAKHQLQEGHVARMLTVLLSTALSSTDMELGWLGTHEHILKGFNYFWC